MSGHRRRPFFSKVVIQNWTKPGELDTRGIALVGLGGLAAHLTPAEALELADRLVDLAEQLEAPTPTHPIY